MIELNALKQFIVEKVMGVPIETRQQIVEIIDRDFYRDKNRDLEDKIFLSFEDFALLLVSHAREIRDSVGAGEILWRVHCDLDK